MRRLQRCLAWWLLSMLPALACQAAEPQQFEFHAPALASDPTAGPALRDLAQRMLPVYVDSDRDRYLTNLSALQMVAGDYAAAHATRQSLHDRQRAGPPGGLRSVTHALLYDLYAHGRAYEASDHVAFAAGFERAFADVVPKLDDLTADGVTAWLTEAPWETELALQHQFDTARTHTNLTLTEGMQLVWAYLAYDTYRNCAPLAVALIREDDQRRYEIDTTEVRTRDGAELALQIMRPRVGDKPLPTLLEVTLGTLPDAAASAARALRECAAHGYGGVVMYARGGTGKPLAAPFEHDAADARAVIEWIAQQAWSDGRVGMYGSGYSAYVQWAVAKHAPRALQALVPISTMVPGIDWPMRGNIFLSAAYRWARSLSVPPPADAVATARLEQLDERWYRSGRRYQDLDRVDDTRVPLFHRWLAHPSYDAYWQALMPSPQELARIDLSVLTLSGYYDTGESGALYSFTQHMQYDAQPDHTLVIGPYDSGALQDEPMAWERGLTLDSVALTDVRELRFQWFDYILKGRPKPTWMTDRINYQLPGANEWRHAASLSALQSGSLRLYLTGGSPAPVTTTAAAASVAMPRLTAQAGTANSSVEQGVDFKDRSDADWTPPVDLVSRTLPTHHSVVFVSDALPQALDLGGMLSGLLEFQLNKSDLDLSLALYELQPSGDYVALFAPDAQMRASFVANRSQRQLLSGGTQRLPFTSAQWFARRTQPGSRIVLVLSVNQRPDEEINYGARSPVSTQSIADAKAPLKVRWLGSSYVDLPLTR